MTVSAAEYAKFHQTDTATFCGMRTAFAQWVINVDHAKAAGTPITEKLLKDKLFESVRHEPSLKVAGTEKLVERYMQETFKGKDLTPLYEPSSGKITQDVLDKAREGKAGVFDMLKAGNSYNSAAMKSMGVEMLTTHFQDSIRNNHKITDGLTVNPTPMTEDQAKGIHAQEKLFRTADAMDIFHKPVRQLLAHSDPAAEKKFQEISGPLQRLAEGKSKDLHADVKAVEEKMGPTPGRGPQTAEDGKKFAEHIKDDIVRKRSGEHEQHPDQRAVDKSKEVKELTGKDYGHIKAPHVQQHGQTHHQPGHGGRF